MARRRTRQRTFSYTHLDGYKRQRGNGAARDRARGHAFGPVPEQGGDAVSYTHLDVYKRQLVKAASERAVPATLLFEPDAQARYLRVDQAIGAIRRNGGSKIAFPGIQRYGGLV